MTYAQKNREKFALDWIEVDNTCTVPMYRQVEQQVRAAILEGRLHPGEKLPSSRQFAADLGIARNTIKSAFNQLVAEGYLSTAIGSGTHVALELPEAAFSVGQPTRSTAQTTVSLDWAPYARRLETFLDWMERSANRPTRPFLAHTPAVDMFPRDIWAQLTQRRLRQTSGDYLKRDDPQGYMPLRRVIAEYLGHARGFSCSQNQIVITAGAQQAIELVAKLVIAPGDVVCVEEPCYTPAKLLFELAGAKVVPVPVDENGIVTDFLINEVPHAKLTYVTPSSQFPLTMTMSLQRRLELIRWARKSGSILLEDDYNGEYRYSGRPLPALHGIVPADIPAIYVGSFSKLLFPSLRSGYLVVPTSSVNRFSAARWLSDRHSPTLEQAVLSDFIEEGHFARHVRRMRTLYKKRQEACVAIVNEHLCHILEASACDVGLHLVGWLKPGVSEADLLAAAKAARVELTPLSLFYSKPPDRPGVLLGYASYTEKDLLRAANTLRDAYHELMQHG